MRRIGWPFAFGSLAAVVGIWFWPKAPLVERGGWGIDAVLTRHVGEVEKSGYVERLDDSGVGWLRERSVGAAKPRGKGKEVSGKRPVAGRDDSVRWSGDLRGEFAALKGRGFSVAAFANLPFAVKPRTGNALPEDLREVYRQGRFLGREFAGLVDAWEMVGEPDLGFCTDLPDRVAAYQAALYLGLKAGAEEATQKPETRNLKPESGANPQASGFKSQGSSARAPYVLMGALGMPPSPWLERAARNGLLDYTDAYNFHFYGHAADLTGVLAAHRAAVAALSEKSETRNLTERGSAEMANVVRAEPDRDGHPLGVRGHRPENWSSGAGELQVSGLKSQVSARQRALPLWITEAGIEAVAKSDFENPDRRRLQAEFTISTAKQALAAEDVAVFMPFILVHRNDPYAMTLSPYRTFPAWDEYAKFTRENPWPKRPLTRAAHQPNSVVVQWLPDNPTTLPRKVGGTYRFKGERPIAGVVRVYNFGETGVRGRLGLTTDDTDTADQDLSGNGERVLIEQEGTEVTVQSGEMVEIPVRISARVGGHFREWVEATFVEEGGRTARAFFGIEREGELADFEEQPLKLRPLGDEGIKYPQMEPYRVSGAVGPWTLVNGLRSADEVLGKRNLVLVAPKASGPPNAQSRLPGTSLHAFLLDVVGADPLQPPMAVAGINGLPERGTIRVRLSRPMTKDFKVLVTFVDDRGQRYSIWENFSVDYYGSRQDLRLNLEDFHLDFWGRAGPDWRFEPQRVKEVHLRFYLSEANKPVGVELSVLEPRR